MIEDYVNR